MDFEVLLLQVNELEEESRTAKMSLEKEVISHANTKKELEKGFFFWFCKKFYTN
jgi:hypothetical protein